MGSEHSTPQLQRSSSQESKDEQHKTIVAEQASPTSVRQSIVTKVEPVLSRTDDEVEDLSTLMARLNVLPVKRYAADPEHSIRIVDTSSPATSDGAGKFRLKERVYEVKLAYNASASTDSDCTHELFAVMSGDSGEENLLVHIANCWHKSSSRCPSYYVLYPVDRSNGVMLNVWRLFPVRGARHIYEFKYNPKFDSTLY